ncbi:Ig-specific serine endopeptidase MIP [Mesomycoplasma neurolyticum]|uniref:Membrane-associated lipoprotein n=1 Tax=Mesomycoplasma neurolyticum TaxID=2120 RepID=A0A449A4L3_9BACT|nr:DUF31 family protein [Mesomycoplasma neurolyticum]VEU59185.1 Membrane-associated lipoprotein precursor [Mesomycoplasma neurolyticum]
MKKKILIPKIIPLIMPIVFISAGCTSESTNGNNVDKTSDSKNSTPKTPDISKIQPKFKFKNNFGGFSEKEQLCAGNVKIYNIDAEVEDKNIDIQIIDIKYDTDEHGIPISNLSGKLTIIYSLTNKNANETLEAQKIEISGFKKNVVNSGTDGIIHSSPVDSTKLSGGEFSEWTNANLLKRYELNSKNYLKELERQVTFNGEIPLDKYRSELKITNDKKEEFDKKAKDLKIDNWDSLKLKGYTIPVFDESGNFKGLKIKEGPGIAVGPSWVDSRGRDPYKITGLSRVLVDQHYKDIALQTYSIAINSQRGDDPKDFEKESGTMWILDYEIPEDNSYPTKWFFGTNLHVVKAFNSKTANIHLQWLNKNAPLRTKFKLVEQDENFIKQSISVKNNDKDVVKVFYEAKDYLNDSYSDYLAEEQKNKLIKVLKFDFWLKEAEKVLEESKKNEKDPKKLEIINNFKNELSGLDALIKSWNVEELDEKFKKLKDEIKNFNSKTLSDKTPYDDLDKIEEFADFAVIEIDFANIAPEFLKGKTPQEFAKHVTNDYFNNKDKQISFLKTSYLKDYTQIQDKIFKNETNIKENHDNLYALGYPRADNDFFFDQYEDAAQIKLKKESKVLWTNADYRLYNQGNVDENQENNATTKNSNNNLSYNIGYRSFIDKPGVTDLFIALPKNESLLYIHNDKKPYLASGLNYVVRQFAPFGGSSGSSVRNQKNELVGIHHSSNYVSAMTGLSLAFRSEGYNYNGAFGKYNLPQYDLIYGGGKDQKTSYRQKLQEKYGDSIKTNLFPNGLKEINEEYKFNK